MAAGPAVPSVERMDDSKQLIDGLKRLHWPLILGLGGLALVRPFLSVIGVMDRLGKPAAPLLVTAAISAIWIAAVGFSRVARPVLTLIAAGVTYAVASMVLAAIVSFFLDGHFDGPLTVPFAIIPVLVTNAVWGAITGGLALLLQRVRGVRSAGQQA